MVDKAPTRALVIGMMAAGMLSACASFGDPQQYHQIERLLQKDEEPIGIDFPIRLSFDEVDNVTTLSVQEELVEALESDDQVTVVSFELGQIMCETLDGVEAASILRFAISPTKTLYAARVSFKVFSGEAFSDGVSRKVWMGKDREEDADGTYRTVSLSWATECNTETFLQTVTTHGANRSMSVVKSVPCDAGSSMDICIVEIDLDLRYSDEPLMPVNITTNNTKDPDKTNRQLRGHRLREGNGEVTKMAGDGRNLQSSTTKIDVLFVYNQDGMRELGAVSKSQMETIIAVYLEDTNDVLVNSEIDLEFVLVHVEEWPYMWDSYDSESVLSTVQANDSVADLRSEYHADLVSLIAPLSDACGIGYLYAGYFEYGYSVTDPNCLASFTLEHEFGHNLGCYHDRDSASDQHEYAHGLRYCTGDTLFQTIMAYPCYGVDIPYFSNPNISYSGLPTGIADEADCSRRIRENMVSVSEYSTSSLCSEIGGIQSWIGDGWCDSINNNEACHWDGDDCCESCCVNDEEYTCGVNGYDCQHLNDTGCGLAAVEPTTAPVTSSSPQITPAPTAGASSAASARIESTLLLEWILLYFAIFFPSCFSFSIMVL